MYQFLNKSPNVFYAQTVAVTLSPLKSDVNDKVGSACLFFTCYIGIYRMTLQ